MCGTIRGAPIPLRTNTEPALFAQRPDEAVFFAGVVLVGFDDFEFGCDAFGLDGHLVSAGSGCVRQALTDLVRRLGSGRRRWLAPDSYYFSQDSIDLVAVAGPDRRV